MSANLLHAVSLVLPAPCFGDADREVVERHDGATTSCGDLVDCAAASVCGDLIAALVEAGAQDDMV